MAKKLTRKKAIEKIAGAIMDAGLDHEGMAAYLTGESTPPCQLSNEDLAEEISYIFDEHVIIIN